MEKVYECYDICTDFSSHRECVLYIVCVSMCPAQHTCGGQRRVPGASLHCFPLSSLEIRFLIEPKTWLLGCKIPRIFPVPTSNSGVAGPCNHAQLLTRVLRIWTQFLIHGQQAVSHLSHNPWFPLNANYFLLFAFNCAFFHMRNMCEGLERWLIQQCWPHKHEDPSSAH